MKKTVKSKLRLNMQTIRSLKDKGMQKVQGGRAIIYTDDTDYCRGCG